MGKRNRERAPKPVPVEKTNVSIPIRLFYCIGGCDRCVAGWCAPWCNRQTKPKPHPIEANER